MVPRDNFLAVLCILGKLFTPSEKFAKRNQKSEKKLFILPIFFSFSPAGRIDVILLHGFVTLEADCQQHKKLVSLATPPENISTRYRKITMVL